MGKRLFDVVCAGVGLLLAAPLLAIAAIGIRLADPGPVLYRARRMGLGGRPFTMYKLRTMLVERGGAGSRVTAANDPRVFRLGRFLRASKIDELPQLVNVLRGEMSFVGPRPEDPDFVLRHYSPTQRETLSVRPGLAGPGSLYHETHCEWSLGGANPEAAYIEKILPLKLALDLVYVRHRSFRYDLAIIARTLAVIAGKLTGRRDFPDPPEMAVAQGFLAPARRRMVRDSSAARAMLALAALTALATASGRARSGPASPLPGWPGDPAAPILVGAGDIASCRGREAQATADLLDEIPGTVFTTGDNAYPDGSPTDYSRCYSVSWGRHRHRTRPVPGNHDYQTAGARGYFGYFGAAAGPAGRGYYSYDLGGWHVLALDSEIDMGASSPQVGWLRADLAAHPSRCTIAFWHTPRFSSGTTHGGSPRSLEVWRMLYAAGVDLVINGHEHHYERFAPQTPAGDRDAAHGIREFVAGTGGSSNYRFGRPQPNSEIRRTGTPGVLALRLLPAGYQWRFVPVAGKDFTDSGEGSCHDAPAQPAPSGAALPRPTVAASRSGSTHD
ncbi:MAG: hypothetical protein DMD43_00090 [Gemmatimonadetes bacterium]|nr:MAG: hypothetical protein DMD43_00090 [Gemmatimonadota bacterium]